MSLSLNEVEALAKKATRGAGYPWGLAEEAGKATRWLCARGIDGCAELAAVLQSADVAPWSSRLPVPGPVWQSQGAELCPLATGAALSDHAELLCQDTVQLGPVLRPMMLAPFAAQIARHVQGCVQMVCYDFTLVTDGTTMSHTGTVPTEACGVMLSCHDHKQLLTQAQQHQRASPDPKGHAILDRFAQRTYAPATEASRLSGAGAGLSDND